MLLVLQEQSSRLAIEFVVDEKDREVVANFGEEIKVEVRYL